MFAVELDRRLSGRGVRTYAVLPGGIRTSLGRHMVPEDVVTLLERAARAKDPPPVMKSIPAGAATSVWAATSPELVDCGGRYLEDCHVAEVRSTVAPNGVRDYALDGDRASRLWARSEELVDETF